MSLWRFSSGILFLEVTNDRPTNEQTAVWFHMYTKLLIQQIQKLALLIKILCKAFNWQKNFKVYEHHFFTKLWQNFQRKKSNNLKAVSPVVFQKSSYVGLM